MKKLIILATLGLAMDVSWCDGQGFVKFSSYYANNDQGAITTIFFGGNWVPVGIGYTADLYYALGTVSDPVNYSLAGSIVSTPTGLTDLGVFAAYDNSGYFDGTVVAIPDYTGGPITFEVVAFKGSSYADSVFRGRSGSFTMDSIATEPYPVPALGDNGQPMPNFIGAVIIPEPTTLGLAGVGGLVSLAVFRRKQS